LRRVQTLTVADLLAFCPNRSLSVDPSDFLSDQLDFQDIDYASQLIHCRHASLASPIPFGQFKQNGIPNQLDRTIAWADERREVRWPARLLQALQKYPVARLSERIVGCKLWRTPILRIRSPCCARAASGHAAAALPSSVMNSSPAEMVFGSWHSATGDQ
jgi:hypothetical protein